MDKVDAFAPWWAVAVVTAVVMQPHGGEVFFSATNAQWWLGLYLFVHFTWMDQQPPGSVWALRTDQVFVVMASLSGPFAFLVWPVMVMRRWINGPRHTWSWLHAWVFFAGLIQLASFLTGDRVHRHEGAVFHAGQWSEALLRLLTFCAATPEQWTAAVAFLMLGAWLIWRDGRAGNKGAAQDALIVAFSVMCLLLAGIWAHKFDPLQAVPMGTGSRYTWIPYALMFMLTCAGAHRAPLVAQAALMALLMTLCFLGHRPVQRSDLQYQAFADFSSVKPVSVPVHPQVESSPGWGLELRPGSEQAPAMPSFSYAPGGTTPPRAVGGSVSQEGMRGWRFVASGTDPQLLFGSPLNCRSGRSIGVEVRMWRSSPGWIQLFWSKDERFSGNRSLRRFYPAGPVVAQFAFRNPRQPTYLRLDPADADIDALIESVDVHCLAEKRP